jgi:hypothetical protein
MIGFLNKIISIKSDLVFVGGVSEMLQGYKENTKDVDMVVTTINGLGYFGNIKCWNTTSPFSISGKRGYIETDTFNIDIFIEEVLPPYIIIQGLPVQDIHDEIKYYERIINEIQIPLVKELMISKLNNLNHHRG